MPPDLGYIYCISVCSTILFVMDPSGKVAVVTGGNAYVLAIE